VRLSTLFLMAILFCAAYALYLVKYEVQSVREEAHLLELQLQEENEALHIANAEWAYLNRPERLQQLADKYLTLKPVQGSQIVELAAIPFQDDQPRMTGKNDKQEDLLTPASARTAAALGR